VLAINCEDAIYGELPDFHPTSGETRELMATSHNFTIYSVFPAYGLELYEFSGYRLDYGGDNSY